jgi:hypothetical protein
LWWWWFPGFRYGDAPVVPSLEHHLTCGGGFQALDMVMHQLSLHWSIISLVVVVSKPESQTKHRLQTKLKTLDHQ